MKPNKTRILSRLFFDQLGDDRWNEGYRTWLTPHQAITALAPVCAMLEPELDHIASLPYQAACETKADKVIADMVATGSWQVRGLDPAVCRVLLERHFQCLQLLITQVLAGNDQAVPVPTRLPAQHHTAAVVMHLAYRMRLPFPVCDRTGMTWPEGLVELATAEH
jgi:hypothetical protein